MIVEMVLTQIGEGRGLQGDPVQPALVDAMRRGFERQMGDAARGQIRQHTRRVGRVRTGQARSRQRAVNVTHLCQNPEGAHARGMQAQGGPDFATEGGHRGLAVGAGDGDAGRGLGTIEVARRDGIGPTHVARGDQDRGQARIGVMGGQHSRRALRQGLGDEASAVSDTARQGHEQRTRRDLAAVGRDPGDHRIGREVAAQQFRQLDRGPGRAHRPSPSRSSNAGIRSPRAVRYGSALRATPRKPAIRSAIRPTAGAATKPPVRG